MKAALLERATSLDFEWVTGTIGIEIEFPISSGEAEDHAASYGASARNVGYTHETYSRVVLKHDGSCGAGGDDGCEVVSPPTRLADLIALRGSAMSLYDTTMALREAVEYECDLGPEAYSRCGIHVHVGLNIGYGEALSRLSRRRFDRLWQSYSARRDSITKFAGVGRDPARSTFARRYCGDYLAMSDKYGQINLSPILSETQDTIEFRQLGHSVEASVPPPFAVPSTVSDGQPQRVMVRSCGLEDCSSCGWVETVESMQQRAEWRRLNSPLVYDPPRLHSWGDVVEWAMFVTALTEAATRPAGWIIAKRDSWGATRPDGQPWSPFWVRPTPDLTSS